MVAALSNLAAAGLARADDLGRQGEDATATLETALSDSAEALLTSRAHGSPLRLAINHRTLGLILARLGRRAEARQHFEACLALGQQHGNRPLAVSAQLALLDLDAARPASAAVIEDMTRLLAQLDEAQMPALALRVHQVLLRLHREQGDLAAALHHFEHVHALELRVREMRTDLQSRVLADRVELEQARRAQMGFNDLLTRLDAALAGPNGVRLAELIRTQFPVALIDEFQDTDAVQYRIFDTVYRVKDNRDDIALILIGDPKQAIYAFRGADIYTYLAARAATAGRLYTLDRKSVV